MAGYGIELDLRELKKIDWLLGRLDHFDRTQLLQGIGALVETQTRRRIEVEKTGPDGAPWAPWSKAYAAERPPGTSLLQSTGDFLDSVTHVVDGDEVRVGSNKVQARILQLGGQTQPHDIRPKNKKALNFPGAGHPVKVVHHPGSKFPPRPWLGISQENAIEIQAEALAFFGHLIQR